MGEQSFGSFLEKVILLGSVCVFVLEIAGEKDKEDSNSNARKRKTSICQPTEMNCFALLQNQ